jgi:hypothetical protein
MENIDLFSIVLLLVGSIMVYGVKYIFKLFKINSDEIKVLVFKLIGLIIACIGFLRIMDII